MPTSLSPRHRMIKTRLWQASALTFALFLLDMFILQWGSFFTDLFLCIFGITMIVDGYASILEQRFQYFGLTIVGILAQIGGGVIILAGAALALAGFSSLLF